VVLATLDELGIDLTDGDSEGWHNACCPLHDEQSPSFTVHVNDGAWRCRAGCGSSPDLAFLVAKVTGESDQSARRRLRLKIPADSRTIVDMLKRRRDRPVRERPPEPLFYERSRVPKYMVDRGFSMETLRRWEVGYDPQMRCAVIPFKADGKLIGLVRRNLGPGPKYMNSRGLGKSGHLFGLDKVDPNSRTVIVTEGPLDCMWLEQFGYPAVALLGASMSAEQADIIKRRFWTVVLGFDQDTAGRLITDEARGILSRLNVMGISLPPGRKDIQECDGDEVENVLASVAVLWYNDLSSTVPTLHGRTGHTTTENGEHDDRPNSRGSGAGPDDSDRHDRGGAEVDRPGGAVRPAEAAPHP